MQQFSMNENDTCLYFFQKLDVMLHDKRRILHKFLSLMEDVEAINKWSITATEHLDRDEDLDRPGVPMMTAGGNGEVVEIGENTYSQIRQIDYLLSKSRELKLRSRHDFEENYDEMICMKRLTFTFFHFL